MKVIKDCGWVYYIVDDYVDLDREKNGKWMYFFSDKSFATKICKDVIEKNIITQSKHTDEESGVACFYLEYDDIDTHKKIISYFVENNLIRRTKSGRLYNISFKLDSQTRMGEYGEEFKAEIKLAEFIDLDTGEWL